MHDGYGPHQHGKSSDMEDLQCWKEQLRCVDRICSGKYHFSGLIGQRKQVEESWPADPISARNTR